MGVGELLEAFLQAAAGPLAPFGLNFQFDLFQRGNPPRLRCVLAHGLRPAVSLGGTPGYPQPYTLPATVKRCAPWSFGTVIGLVVSFRG